jgi:NADH dehydrogenase [ubiquinone] 1 alpha subcomplex assembly factor 6
MSKVMQPKLISNLALQVKKYDYERFLCTLFAKNEHMEPLFTLYAFNIEIARVAELVTEEMMGLVRLQWWSDEIENIYNGKFRDHHILTPLAGIIEKYQLDKDAFLQLIRAREFDLRGEPPETIQELVKYCDHSSAHLLKLAAQIMGLEQSSSLQSLGIAWAIIGHIRAIKYREPKLPLMVPVSILESNGITKEDFFQEPQEDKAATCIKELAELAQKFLDQFDRQPHDKNMRLYEALSRKMLKRLERARHNVLRNNIEPSKLALLFSSLFIKS